MPESARSKIILSVVSSLITAGILWFTGLLPLAWSWTIRAISVGWRWLQETHIVTVSGFILSIVLLFSVIGFLSFVRFAWGKTRWHRDSPARYANDHFFGAKWTWDYVFGSLSNIWCECPHCATTLVYTEQPDANLNYRTFFSCERCGHRTLDFEGRKDYAISKVHRQIERKIKTGEFRKARE